MVVMVILTLQEWKRTKEEEGEPNIVQVDRRKMDGSKDTKKFQINKVIGILFQVVGFSVICQIRFFRKLGILYLGLWIGTLAL